MAAVRRLQRVHGWLACYRRIKTPWNWAIARSRTTRTSHLTLDLLHGFRVCPPHTCYLTPTIPINTNHSINLQYLQYINQSINQLFNQSINQSNNQSTNQSITRLINTNHSINISIQQPIKQTLNQPVTQSTNYSIKQSTKQGITQSKSILLTATSET